MQKNSRKSNKRSWKVINLEKVENRTNWKLYEIGLGGAFLRAKGQQDWKISISYELHSKVHLWFGQRIWIEDPL